MSNSSIGASIGRGSTSNGNFWYGGSMNFPGFLYKKMLVWADEEAPR